MIFRKIAHMAEYGVFSILLFRAWQETFVVNIKKVFWICLVLSVGYAISDEFHQSFVPGRQGSPIDVFIDSAGALLGLMFWKCKKEIGILRGKQ